MAIPLLIYRFHHLYGFSNSFIVFFSRSVLSDSWWPRRLQHGRLPCPSSSLGACSNSCPLSQWCHPTISSCVIPFSCSLQSFPASGSFPMSWLFVSSGQSTGVSASVSVLPMNIQGWLPLGLTGLIFLLSIRLWRVFFNNTVQKHQFFGAQPLFQYSCHSESHGELSLVGYSP